MDLKLIFTPGQSFFRLCIISVLFCSSRCASQPPDEIYSSYDKAVVPFELYNPVHSFTLPGKLEEISGLTYAGEGTLAAVEDENAVLYFLDATDGSVRSKIDFGKRGDYEAVENLGGRYYIMESNGDLTHFIVKNDEASDIHKVDTDFSSNNDIEGLAVFEDHLLVACKANGEVRKNNAGGKAIYRLNTELEVISEPFMLIDRDKLEDRVRQRLPKVRINDFDPSGIATDPVSGFIYVISADHILSVFSPDLRLAEVVLLNKKIYRQPEGICFDPEGNLYISSEGAGRKAMLFVLKRL